jgi:hypothetical protein
MPRHDRTRLDPSHAIGLLVVLALCIIACIAAVSWVILCTRTSDANVCAGLAVSALPVHGRIRALHRRMQRWLLHIAMRETERQIEQYFRLLQDDADKLHALRERLGQQQLAQLRLLSQP